MKTSASLVLAGALSLAALSAAAQTTAPANGPRVVVPAHDIERGETLTEYDLVLATVAPERMRPGVVKSIAELAGHEARRLLRAGDPIRSEDVRMPVLVAKGAMVTMTYAEPGITLTATGKAMGEGGLGETVAVENPVSFRQVSCIVIGPGEVRAGGDVESVTRPQVAANP
jgi:flagella basal body P-ring formation protein FlgA